MKNSPALRGATLALLAAALFGLSAPLIRHFGIATGPWTTAALLYVGAACAGFLWRSGVAKEAAVRRSDWPRLGMMALFGGAFAPFALAWGLQRTSALSGSLALTLEAVFTAVLAAIFYREHLGRRVIAAVILISTGGLLLAYDSAHAGELGLLGFLAVIGATLAWGVDNTLSRPLAERDPGSVVLYKAAAGSACSILFAFLFAESLPTPDAALVLLLIGLFAYGMSLRFYLFAQRAFGAARTGSVFATAPFIGAVAALALGERGVTVWLASGAALILIGVVLHLTERHRHWHQHQPMEHEHAHTHGDGHHEHSHEVMPAAAHSHWHSHAAVAHSHAHVPDLHHTHQH